MALSSSYQSKEAVVDMVGIWVRALLGHIW